MNNNSIEDGLEHGYTLEEIEDVNAGIEETMKIFVKYKMSADQIMSVLLSLIARVLKAGMEKYPENFPVFFLIFLLNKRKLWLYR